VQTVEFAKADVYPFADTIFKLYQGGFLTSVSVGFKPLEDPLPIKDEKTGEQTGYEFVRQELMELSAVPLPANTNAVARSARVAGVSEREMKDFFTRCNLFGEKNPPWANMVPGVTFAEEESKPNASKESNVGEFRSTIQQVMERLVETNQSLE